MPRSAPSAKGPVATDTKVERVIAFLQDLSSRIRQSSSNFSFIFGVSVLIYCAVVLHIATLWPKSNRSRSAKSCLTYKMSGETSRLDTWTLGRCRRVWQAEVLHQREISLASKCLVFKSAVCVFGERTEMRVVTWSIMSLRGFKEIESKSYVQKQRLQLIV